MLQSEKLANRMKSVQTEFQNKSFTTKELINKWRAGATLELKMDWMIVDIVIFAGKHIPKLIMHSEKLKKLAETVHTRSCH
jgi:hypothetical protein